MCGLVPGLPPVPEQSGQGASEVSRSEMVTPSMASVKLIVAEVSTSGPFAAGGAPAGRRRAAAEQVAEHVAEAAAAAGAVAEQVVEVEAPAAATRREAAAEP